MRRGVGILTVLSCAGFEPAKVVFDSPVKTPQDIKEAIDLGLHMNLDNELEVWL